MKLCALIQLSLLTASMAFAADTPIAEVLNEINPATGKAKDPSKEFTVSGIVATKVTLADDKVLLFVLNPGERALVVQTDAKEAGLLVPRTELTLSGHFGEGPWGATFQLKPGSASISATNKAFGFSEPRGGAFFKDASSLAGRYVQLTNVTVPPGPFAATGLAKAKSIDGTEVTLVLSKAVAGLDAPTEPVNVFGIVVKVGEEWRLATARFLLARGKEVQALATKRTCLTCHNPDTKLLGPPYREVAAKYRRDTQAVAALTLQMEKGGVGKWGPVPMPPLGGVVPAEDRKALAEWIMSYKWDALLAE